MLVLWKMDKAFRTNFWRETSYYFSNFSLYLLIQKNKTVEKHSYDDINVSTIPKVSVVMIAYNLEKYLAEAIESVLMQKVNFSYELVIGEDCSTDNTRAIALDYRARYPEIIKVLLPKKNQGLTPNCVATHNACSGEYIALLDGDDYWTDINKLQSQIDFLDTHTDFSASAHQAEIIFDDIAGTNGFFGATTDAVLTVNDMLQHRKFHTSSLVYRREYWVKSGGIPTTILSNERAIYPMLSIFGKIMYWKRNMCVYRRSSAGVSSRITVKMLSTDLKMIPWLKKLDPTFPIFRYKSFLHFSTYTYPKKGKFILRFHHFIMFTLYSFSYFPKNLGDVRFALKKLFRP